VRDIETKSELDQAGWKGSQKLGGTLRGDINAEEARSHGERMTRGQAQGINQLVEALKAVGNSQETINQIIKEMMDLHLSHAQKLAELWRALSTVKAQVRAVHN